MAQLRSELAGDRDQAALGRGSVAPTTLTDGTI
jgi:hypothetical protein